MLFLKYWLEMGDSVDIRPPHQIYKLRLKVSWHKIWHNANREQFYLLIGIKKVKVFHFWIFCLIIYWTKSDNSNSSSFFFENSNDNIKDIFFSFLFFLLTDQLRLIVKIITKYIHSSQYNFQTTFRLRVSFRRSRPSQQVSFYSKCSILFKFHVLMPLQHKSVWSCFFT